MNNLNFGTVRCFDTRTGEGWIIPDDGSHDIVVKQAAIDRARLGQLADGQTLGFQLDEKRRAAVELWATWSNR